MSIIDDQNWKHEKRIGCLYNKDVVLAATIRTICPVRSEGINSSESGRGE